MASQPSPPPNVPFPEIRVINEALLKETHGW